MSVLALSFSQRVALNLAKDMMGEECWRLTCGIVQDVTGANVDTLEIDLDCGPWASLVTAERSADMEVERLSRELAVLRGCLIQAFSDWGFSVGGTPLDDVAMVQAVNKALQILSEQHRGVMPTAAENEALEAEADYLRVCGELEAAQLEIKRLRNELQAALELRGVVPCIASGPDAAPHALSMESIEDDSCPQAGHGAIMGNPSDGGRPSAGKLEPGEPSHREMLGRETLERVRGREANGVPSAQMPEAPRVQHGQPLEETTAAPDVPLDHLPSANVPWWASFEPMAWEMLMRGAVAGDKALTITAFVNNNLTISDAKRIPESAVINFIGTLGTIRRVEYLRSLSEHDRRRWFAEARKINEARYARRRQP